jgi:hypothetical protein
VSPDDLDLLDRLKRSDIISAFWLPPHGPEIQTHSYSDLELIQAIHKSYIKRIRVEQHFRLKPIRTRELQRVVTRYFGRPNSFDSHSDRVPRTGTYLCVGCFYMDARVTPTELTEGVAFQQCPACRGTQWVAKGG